jgi:co-chaperonin GroES (HSP10)
MAMSREARERAERDEERAERQRSRPSREGNLEEAADKVSSIYRKSTVAYDSLEAAFPAADPALRPFGSDVIVQIRTPKLQTAGGIMLTEDTRETDQWNTQVAKVIAWGAVAFRNRETLEPWPEGCWVKEGMFVRVPKYGGDKWWREAKGSPDGKALFAQFNDLDLKGEVPEDQVLSIIAFI